MPGFLLAAVLLGPPAPEPAAAPEYDEAVIIEPAPLVREDVEAPEWIEPIAIPEGPTTIALPPPPPPPDGSGRLVGGSLAIGLGIGAFVAIDQELRRQNGNPTYVAATFVPLGLASMGIGIYTLVRGAKARANFNDWKKYTGYEVPPQGNGLLVGGTMLAAVGSVVLIAGSMRSTRGQQDFLTTALLSVGGAALVGGGTQLAVGLVRRERHRRWRRNSLFVMGPPWLAPIAAGGLALGVVGGF